MQHFFEYTKMYIKCVKRKTGAIYCFNEYAGDEWTPCYNFMYKKKYANDMCL